jgi:hypothetical protein
MKPPVQPIHANKDEKNRFCRGGLKIEGGHVEVKEKWFNNTENSQRWKENVQRHREAT